MIINKLIYLINNKARVWIVILIQIPSSDAIGHGVCYRPGRQIAVKNEKPVTTGCANAYITYNRLRGISDTMYIAVYLARLGVKNASQLFGCSF